MSNDSGRVSGNGQGNGKADLQGSGYPSAYVDVHAYGQQQGNDQVALQETAASMGITDEATQVMLRFQDLMARVVECERSIMLSYFQGSASSVPAAHETNQSPEEQTPDSPALGEADEVADPTTSETPEQQSEGPNSETLTEQLFELVSERTGYPTEMLDLDLDLEANLGIDSIKRVEILGTLAESFGAAGTDGLESQVQIETLTGIRTLRGILEYLEKALCGAQSDPAPTEQQEDESPQEQSGQLEIQRATIRVVDAAIPAGSTTLVPSGAVLLTDDGRGVAAELAGRLSDFGQAAILIRTGSAEMIGEDEQVYCADLCDPDAVDELLARLRQEAGPIAGLVHAATLGEGLESESALERAHREVKSLYLLARGLENDLREAGKSGGAFLLAPTALGGSLGFGSTLPNAVPAGQGGILGFVKCLALEWPEVLVRAVDLDGCRPSTELADQLATELEDREGPLEVGHVGQRRVTWEPVADPLTTTQNEVAGVRSKHDDPRHRGSARHYFGGCSGNCPTLSAQLGARRPLRDAAGIGIKRHGITNCSG